MPRLTITLSEERHQALKEAAARRGKTIGAIIEESLDFYGIKTEHSALGILEKARRHSGLDEEQALQLAVQESRAARKQRS